MADVRHALGERGVRIERMRDAGGLHRVDELCRSRVRRETGGHALRDAERSGVPQLLVEELAFDLAAVAGIGGDLDERAHDAGGRYRRRRGAVGEELAAAAVA